MVWMPSSSGKLQKKYQFKYNNKCTCTNRSSDFTLFLSVHTYKSVKATVSRKIIFINFCHLWQFFKRKINKQPKIELSIIFCEAVSCVRLSCMLNTNQKKCIVSVNCQTLTLCMRDTVTRNLNAADFFSLILNTI